VRFVVWSLAAVFLAFAGWITYLAATAPDVAYLARENPKTTAFAEAWKKSRGQKSAKTYQEWADFDRFSPYLIGAVLVAEDVNFWEHPGYDWAEIKKALKTDIKRKKFARGASTITQQLAKNLFLSGSKTPGRKIKEFFVARDIEKKLTKERIFELYLNWVEWGEGIFGGEAASWHYFQKPASDLWPEEAVRLASILPNPKKFSPFSDSAGLRRKRNLILQRMVKYKMITQTDYELAKKELDKKSS
jgi:monofunctional biosynthetic peptidoglycan transglycosylase